MYRIHKLINYDNFCLVSTPSVMVSMCRGVLLSVWLVDRQQGCR